MLRQFVGTRRAENLPISLFLFIEAEFLQRGLPFAFRCLGTI